MQTSVPIVLLCVLAVALGGANGCASGNGSGSAERATAPEPQQGTATSLQHDLDALTAGVAPDEALRLAEAALAESARLSAEYRMTRPALFNNALVNVGLKERGLCWHWTEDLIATLRRLPLPNYQLHWGIAHRGKLFREHNSLVVTARGEPFATGIVLDPWRLSGALHWVAVREDRYPWEPR